MKGQQQVLYLSLSLCLFGTAFLWENHKGYLLLLVTHNLVYFLDPRHSNTPVCRGGNGAAKSQTDVPQGNVFLTSWRMQL